MKKYRVTSDLVTSKFEGLVIAKSKKEAIRKFEENDDMISFDEYPECEQINTKCEECD